MPVQAFAEELLLPLITRTLEILMANLYFKSSPPSRPTEYYEIRNSGSLLTAWHKSCGKDWAHIKQILGIPPGFDWHVVEWDSKVAAIRYRLIKSSNPNPPPPLIGLGPKYMNHDTGQPEERPTSPPPRRNYAFTLRAPSGTLTEQTETGVDLDSLVRVQQQLRPDHVIISITYKGDA